MSENPHGAEIREDGTVRFRLWAPAVAGVELDVLGQAGPRAMQPIGEGWHELITARASAGDRYRFILPDGLKVPDPASRYQPEDVHGPSELIDPASWTWTDASWKNRPWEEAVVYELHIGTFTPEGTFQAAIEKLDPLARLGVTAIEIMPVGDFPGRRNWGYDGVLPYAPDSSYGRPEDLKAFIEEAHARGLMVLLDVMYNHFGPDGNYLSVYAPQFFSRKHKTPWGAAINFDGACSRPVRDFVVCNAIYWLRQYHFDGLRLDAVHAIADDSPKHILRELAERVRAEFPDARVHLVLENEKNEARWLEPDDTSRPALYTGLYTAQWNDDLHHVLHTAVTGEDQGYYAEYRGDSWKLGRSLAEGFAFQGETMHYKGRPRGEVSSHLPPSSFVAFLQNHDQVGNRAFGDRIGAGVLPHVLRAAAACYLLLPQVPMLFMGEEWNSLQPFPFFCDFGPDLADAVRQGRRDEFARFPEFQDPSRRELIPDPQAVETFDSAKLRWDDLDEPAHREWLEWYRKILDVRRQSIQPLMTKIRRGGAFRVLDDGAVRVTWQLESAGELQLATNLSAVPVHGFSISPSAPIWQEGSVNRESGILQPWTVVWSVNL
jgi:malto-oligosyltrehalose trehalohydrolase